jgi:hypothetical protein
VRVTTGKSINTRIINEITFLSREIFSFRMMGMYKYAAVMRQNSLIALLYAEFKDPDAEN